MSLFLVSQREDSFSLQLLLPQPVYPSPNAIYPSCSPLETAAGALTLLRHKHSPKNVHGLTEPKGISLPPSPRCCCCPFVVLLIQPPVSARAATWAGLARSDAPGTSTGSANIYFLFTHSMLTAKQNPRQPTGLQGSFLSQWCFCRTQNWLAFHGGLCLVRLS